MSASYHLATTEVLVMGLATQSEELALVPLWGQTWDELASARECNRAVLEMRLATTYVALAMALVLE